ncbi:MAG: hypothetical protein AAGE59_25535, partial [Cyanobacteria bacterium P01_F01_bin.86]
MIGFLRNIGENYIRWLSSPELNAAGRIGLFRILYGLFSLWICSYLYYDEMVAIPELQWRPIFLLSWLETPPYTLISFSESLLVGSLFLLLIGYQTRLSTLVVLFLGSGLTAIRISLFMSDHLFMIQYFYVPLFMSLSCWGDTYSIDSILKRRRGKLMPYPNDPSWRYFWPLRGLLVIYSALMFSSAYAKIQEGDWLVNPHFVGRLLVHKTVYSYLENGFPVNPIAIFISQHPFLHIPIQYGTLIFEAVSIFILFSPLIRFIFFRIIPIFHFSNTFLMGIPFATVIGIYLAFPDWQSIYERFYPKSLCFNWLNRLPSPVLIGGAITGALLVGVTWNTLPLTRYIFSFFQLVTFHAIWLIIFPFALAWAVISIYRESK